MARVFRSANKTVAYHAEVQKELDHEIAAALRRAEAKLARHRKTGAHSVGVETGDLDRYLYLEGPAAMSVELGHDVVTEDGEVVGDAEGLYIISDAIGLPRRGSE